MSRLAVFSLAALALASCAEELLVAPSAPGLEGALTDGRWEHRQRTAATFWPPTVGETRFSEMIDFTCVEGAKGQVRVVITGDTEKTGLWIAGERMSEKTVVVETARGSTDLAFSAGELMLPFRVVRTDADWLQPLKTPGTRVAINAYGDRIYRFDVTEKLSRTLSRCGSPQ
ncbi:hypothetical protein HK107_05660 [Parvularcula sp. ZS-1/3]|uniref:Lipoprotein n=1 Tax=Parvularcula mediterranea TaxID=2732508 RepID=A0A7Y3RLL9_9PROT|nr:hypothetical protein [Parvularcula mediterranea]NNU15806.1 hypothetical protein [Parvularcula mediterranea]